MNHNLSTLLILVAATTTYTIQYSDLPTELLNKSMSLSSEIPDRSTVVDCSVDPAEYLIGPGDAFSIEAVGMSSNNYLSVVNQNGELYFKELGMIRLGRMPLASALDTLRFFVKEHLRLKVDVFVSLAKVKKVVVSVTGPVANPGSYTLDGSYRVLDAIKAANNGLLPSLSEYNYREVMVITGDSTRVLDLFKYMYKNDSSNNPYVYPSDRIAINLSTCKALINGAVKNTVGGMVPVKNQESALELVSLFPLDASADSNQILYKSIDERTVRHLQWSDLWSIRLKDSDVLTICKKKEYTQTDLVNVLGEIARPGIYPIIRGVTTARQIVEMAGGPTSYARSNEIVILRAGASLNDRTKNQIKEEVQLPTEFVRPEMTSAFTRLGMTNDYTVIKVGSRHSDCVLMNNDQVLLPRLDDRVYVSGNVNHPGAYPFSKGKNPGYYVGKAGGFTGKADKSNLFVCTKYPGAVQIKGAGEIEPGDIVVVPDSQQNKFVTTLLIPVLQTMALVLSTAFTIYTVLNK